MKLQFTCLTGVTEGHSVLTKSARVRKADISAGCSRKTLIKAFPSPDLRCEAAFSLANPCDPPEVAKEMLI